MTARGILTSTVVAAATLATTVLAAAPAGAATLRLDDPVGDASGAIDLTSVTTRNGDHAVTVRVAMADWALGRIAVSIDRRRGRGVTLYEGTSRRRSFEAAYDRAFTDGDGPSLDDPLRCPRLRVTRDEAAAEVVFRMPSRCLHGGDYGAVRVIGFSEDLDVADSDLAPDEDDSKDGAGFVSSAWVPRG